MTIVEKYKGKMIKKISNAGTPKSEFLVVPSIPDEIYENTLIIIDDSPLSGNVYLYEEENCQEGDIIINYLANGMTGIKVDNGKVKNILCIKNVKKKVGEDFIELPHYYYYKDAYRPLDYEDIVFDADHQTVHEEWKFTNSCSGGYSRISNNQIQVHGAYERNSHADPCSASFTSQKFYEYSKLRLNFNVQNNRYVVSVQIKDAYTNEVITSNTYGAGNYEVIFEPNKPFYLFVSSTSKWADNYSTIININSISVMKN